MATIITKNSSTASSVPLAAQLVQGELAVNVTDKRLFTENSGGTVVELGTNPSSLSTGNLAFTGTGNRITGDFSNATIASRVLLQSSTANGVTDIGAIPNGTATLAQLTALGSSSAANCVLGAIRTTAGTDVRLISSGTGTFTFLPMTFYTGGSERVRVDTSGNVGIGTSSPSQKLDVNGNIVTDSYSLGAGNGIFFRKGFETTAQPSITVEDHSGSAPDGLSVNGADGVSFKTGNTERARIDSSGNLLVGTTDGTKGALTVGKAAPNAAYGQICALSPTAGDSATSGMSVVKYANDSTTAQVLMRFLINQGGAGQGQINANGANTAAFGSYSDSRLKENIVNLPSQLDSIMALRPVEYDYIESMGGGHQIGFVAQEVQAIYPDLVGEDAEGMLTLTDMNKNDARLIKCIQEQQTLITALTARITALETA